MGNCKLYRLQKRHNSTLQPTGTATDTDVVLKGGTDIISPTFTMHHNTFPTYNYVKYNGRYYFVNKIVAVRDDLFDMECEVDVLATYKESIKAASAFVLYYSHTNNEISDTRLSVKTTPTLASDTAQFQDLGTGESYLITVVGSENTAIFACNKNYVDSLFNPTLTDGFDNDWDTALDAMLAIVQDPSIATEIDALVALGVAMLSWQKRLKGVTNSVLYAADAAEYVKNCYVLPISTSNIGGTSYGPIKLGKWNSNAYGKINFPRIQLDSASVTIPWQQGAGDPTWLKNSPYHHMYLYIPYIGLIELPVSEIIDANVITVNAAIDTYSGVVTFVVNASNGAVLGQYSTNVAAPYAIGASNINVISAGAQIIASATSIAAGAATGNILAATGGALGIVNALKPIDQSISSNGGAAGMGLGNTVKIFSVFHDVTVNPHSQSAIAGEPYNGVHSLNISGYVQTSGASVAEVVGDPVMVDYERNLINDMLDGGIYIE